MEKGDRVRSLRDYVDILHRRWLYPTIIVPVGIFTAVLLAFTLPTLYRSSATILLEPSSIPADMVRTTVTSYADLQIDLVRRAALSSSRLVALVKEVDPYPDQRALTPEDKAIMVADATWIERVDPITLEPLAESTAFSLHYDNPDPTIARAIAARLALLFLTYNREVRTAQAGETYEFLKSKSEELSATVEGLSGQIADFKKRYPNALPDDQLDNRDSLERTRRDLDSIESQARLAEQREAVLAVQLSQLSATLVGAVSDTRTDLATLRAELAAAQQRYSPDHPDIKRLRRAIETLLAQGATNAAPAGSADNPEYLQTAAELEAARRDVAALRSQAMRARAQIAGYEQRLRLAPNLEKEYLQLERDRDMAIGQLENARTMMRAAEMAQKLESEQRGERYTLIQRPRVPDSPVSPNRLGIILLGLVLSMAVAFGLVVVLDVVDPTVRTTFDIADLTDLPIVGTIPVMLSPADQQRRRLQLRMLAIAGGVATVAMVLTVLRTLS